MLGYLLAAMCHAGLQQSSSEGQPGTFSRSTCSQAHSDARKEQMTLAGPRRRSYVLALMLKKVITFLASAALFPLFCCSVFPSPHPSRIQLEWSLTNWTCPYHVSRTGPANCTFIKATSQWLTSTRFGQPSASMPTPLSLQRYLCSAWTFFQGPFLLFCLLPGCSQPGPATPSSHCVPGCLSSHPCRERRRSPSGLYCCTALRCAILLYLTAD